MMRFLTDELQDAEDAGDRGTWTVGQATVLLTEVQSGLSVMYSAVGTVLMRS